MIVLGVDPGIHGGIAWVSGRRLIVDAVDMPVLATSRNGKDKDEVDADALGLMIRDKRPDIAVVELVGAMPNQGTTSMFAFGRSYGIVLGVLGALEILTYNVTPATWKREMGVQKSKSDTENKELARQCASELMPMYTKLWKLKKNHGRAEAALIALYGHTRFRQE